MRSPSLFKFIRSPDLAFPADRSPKPSLSACSSLPFPFPPHRSVPQSLASSINSSNLFSIDRYFPGYASSRESSSVSFTNSGGRRLTYSEVLEITKYCETVIGFGRRGIVSRGRLDDNEVAVKLLYPSSAQHYKQFSAEAEVLLRVHHKNLVSLVGYCDDGEDLALIYEFMANGNLKEHLSGKRGGDVLTWARRVRIAVDVAHGLEYLHCGCKPAMVHRDVKTTNILLNEHFQAKLADLGLSRSFPFDESNVPTVVTGTPGYLDPVYYRTGRLSEKSDVFSFGVVLLEIITSQPVIDKSRKRPHIAEWVGFKLRRGDVKSVVDPKLKGDYDINGVWKALELAFACLNPSSTQRPTMPQVIQELYECGALEMSREQGRFETYTEDSMSTYSEDSIDLSLSLESDSSLERDESLTV